ncbi:hypothetical protein ACTVZO_17885 [Streptomyces sp. IBSNAI002]|uniref:hypothetical protein n=1 Tax=Streptomyces sp. IBSNAI002 TaxID=3457500 RepID=UPI003FD1F428
MMRRIAQLTAATLLALTAVAGGTALASACPTSTPQAETQSGDVGWGSSPAEAEPTPTVTLKDVGWG